MWLLLWALVPLVYCQNLTINPNNEDNGLRGNGTSISHPVDISNLFNNRAFAKTPGDANYDGLHSGYPADFLPPQSLTYAGVNFKFPQYCKSGNDNVISDGQVIKPAKGHYFSMHMLAAAESDVTTGSIIATYADNSTSNHSALLDPWWDWPYPYGGDIVFPYYLTNETIDFNRSMIFHNVIRLDSSKVLSSLTLPSASKNRLHMFSISMVPAESHGIKLEIQQARTTNMWVEDTNKTQIVQVAINNVGNQWLLANHSAKVTISAPGLKTVQPAYVKRLRPGDQARVQVGVINTNGTAQGTRGPATVHIKGHNVQVSSTFNATYGITPYDATFDSIYGHESPMWYSNAKYGIFIHWGVYAVPGWGNVGKNESYAEWYWWDMNQGPSLAVDTYDYNLQTYGSQHVYDDFIQNFTASAFDPKAWVDLFDDAGAKYFVQVSKHHDGYALFDLPANITTRTSVAQYPHKNLLQMLFDAAAKYQPHLHRATYFSLPEWFHPDYAPYGFGDWPGGNATNPYTNATLPYTGYAPVADYVSDLILPEMQALAAMGTEIMWCDIGGPNLTAEFAAAWFNDAAAAGRQVVLNNRCGLPGDFDTPEYARYDAVQLRKWESNLGLDPFSYGYNRATPASAYLSPAGIVTSLVDIVAKNGNFLLDIGPRADGTVVQVEQDNLRGAGRWIHDHEEAIFNTTYWFVAPEDGQAVRFTQTLDAFYVLTLYPPNATLVVNQPVPFVRGDRVTVVGGKRHGERVPARVLGNGSLELRVSDEVRKADEYSWVFRIPY